jgi:diaminopimelate epimerase
MTPVPFCKFHGFGNEYIVVERSDAAGREPRELAGAMCDPRTGPGADGIALIGEAEADADFFCEIINPDGSIAGFSGNGTRCAVAYLHYKNIWTADTLRLATRSGIKNYRLIETESPGHYVFEAEIGRPRFSSVEVPFAGGAARADVIDEPIALAGGQYTFSAVNVGNPVACIFMNSFDLDWRQIGRELESHPLFPERTNVVFANVLDRRNVEVRIWERGAGETSASGTCSAAAAVLGTYQNKTGREVEIHSPGGTTRVVWRDDGEIVLTGRADLIGCGEWTV